MQAGVLLLSGGVLHHFTADSFPAILILLTCLSP
jgi:hypothetical protein